MRQVMVIVAAILIGAGSAAAQPATGAAGSIYRQLQEWRFDQAIALDEEGITFSRDVGTWELRNGRVMPMEPTGDGAVTGMVFEGEGVFHLSIPDPIEVEQMRRFAQRPELLERMEIPFSRLVLRTSGPWLAALLPGSGQGVYTAHRLAQDRHQEWLRFRRLDADARVVAGLYWLEDEYLLVDMETADFGWMAFQFEPWDHEEITLSVVQRTYEYTETWVSLDRVEDRDERGRPTMARRAPVAVAHADIAVDLAGHDGREGDADPTAVRFEVTLTLEELVSGPQAVQFRLHPWASVSTVRTGEGKELPVIRDHFGRRFTAVDRKIHDSSLVVVLDRPLSAGGRRTLTFEYELFMHNYASGRSWYPGLRDSFEDSHTARITFSLPARLDVRAVGRLQEESGGDRERTAVWVVERPTKMLGFTVGRNYREETITLEGLPPVVSFGARSSAGFGNMVRNVGVDVANALHFFQWYFDTLIPAERIVATRIGAWHGQAFDGLIHLAGFTYDRESPGASELFRGHEAAHQYWGHMVGWASYRDQWLSEAFAEYSAMLWIEATMKDGKVIQEILDVYTAQQLGSLSSAMSKFSRPNMVALPPDVLERIGPIGVGYRAGTALAPMGYQMQVYNKGALVLHMIRTMLRNSSGSDDLFRRVMIDLLKSHQGDVIGTADFAGVLARHTKADWEWFFDQWVYGAHIPTYTWSSSIPRRADEDGRWVVEVTVTQTGVPTGFKMPVPVRVDFGGGREGQFILPVDRPERTFQVPLSARPRSLEFNPGYAVLARVRGR